MTTKLKSFILLALAIAELCGALTTAKLTTNSRDIVQGIGKKIYNRPIGVSVFSVIPEHNGRGVEVLNGVVSCFCRNFVTRITQKMKITRSKLLSLRMESVFEICTRRFLTIILSVMISANTYPSHAKAIHPTNSLSQAPSVAKITRIETADNYHVPDHSSTTQDCRVVENADIFSDSNLGVDGDGITCSTVLRASETNGIKTRIPNDGPSSTESGPEDYAEVVTPENHNQRDDDQLVLNDGMLKKGIRNILVLGSGASAVLLLGKKSRSNLAADDHSDDSVTRQNGEENIDNFPVVETSSYSTLPLSGVRYIQARKQPKSLEEEAMLAMRYKAISTVEERAYQILVDLGMIEVTM